MKKKHPKPDRINGIDSDLKDQPAAGDEALHLENFIAGRREPNPDAVNIPDSYQEGELLGEDFYKGMISYVKEQLSGEELTTVELHFDSQFMSFLFPESQPQDLHESRAAAASFQEEKSSTASDISGSKFFPITPYLHAALNTDGTTVFLSFVSDDERLVNKTADIEIQFTTLEIMKCRLHFRKTGTSVQSGELSLPAEELLSAKMLIRFV